MAKNVEYREHLWERKIYALPKRKIKDMPDVSCDNGTTGLDYMILTFSVSYILLH
jgi:hypothetical protein